MFRSFDRYGDLCPTTVAGKAFACIFGLAGIALLGAAVATIGSRLVQAEVDAAKMAQRESRKRLLQVYDKMPKLVTKIRRASNKEQKNMIKEARRQIASIKLPHVPSFIKTLWKTIGWITQSLLVVALCGVVIGRLEGWSYFNSIYYSMITGKCLIPMSSVENFLEGVSTKYSQSNLI